MADVATGGWRPGGAGASRTCRSDGRSMSDLARSPRCTTPIADARPRRRHRRDRGLHPPHQLRGRPRDHPPGQRDLTLARLTPDLIYDQMIAGGRRPQAHLQLAGQPGRGRPATRSGGASRMPTRQPLEIEEYSHFGMVGPLHGGGRQPALLPAAELLRDRPAEGQSADPADRLALRRRRRSTPCRRSGRTSRSSTPSAPTRPATPRSGACSAARRRRPSRPTGSSWSSRSSSTRRSSGPTPTGRSSPGLIVDAVVVEPCGAHPSYVQGAYDRDNRFYLDWDPISRDEAALQAWLAEWVYGLDGRADVRREARSRAAGRPSSRAARPRRARSTTASTDERATAGLLEVRDDDRGRGPRARRPARLLRRRRPAEHRGQPGQADGRARPRARLRGGRLRRPSRPACRCRSATRRSSPGPRP